MDIPFAAETCDAERDCTSHQGCVVEAIPHFMQIPYAERLNARITPEQVAAWSTGASADWTWEAHQIAVTKIYAKIPAEGPTHRFSDDYVKAGQALVDEQLSRAGIRLAHLLNEALGKN